QAAGVPFFVSIVCAALFAAAAGVIVGLPALRLKGVYLAIATIAFNVIVEEIIARWTKLTGGNEGKHLKPVEISGWKLDSDAEFYFLCLALTMICCLACINLLRSPTGRAFVAPEQFTLFVSIELITIVILGGVGFLHGAVLGSIFIIVLPQLISIAKDWLPEGMAPTGLQAVVSALSWF